MTPAEAVSTLAPGDAALGRLDVRRTLDGIDDGLWGPRGPGGSRRDGPQRPRHPDRDARQARDRPPPSPRGPPSSVDTAHPARASYRDAVCAGRGQAPARQLGPERGRLRDGRRARGRARGLGGEAGTSSTVRSYRRSCRRRAGNSGSSSPVTASSARCGGAAPGEWRTNVALGAGRVPVKPSPTAVLLALAARARPRRRSLESISCRPGRWLHDPRVNGAVDFTRENRPEGDIFRETVTELAASRARSRRSGPLERGSAAGLIGGGGVNFGSSPAAVRRRTPDWRPRSARDPA